MTEEQQVKEAIAEELFCSLNAGRTMSWRQYKEFFPDEALRYYNALDNVQQLTYPSGTPMIGILAENQELPEQLPELYPEVFAVFVEGLLEPKPEELERIRKAMNWLIHEVGWRNCI